MFLYLRLLLARVLAGKEYTILHTATAENKCIAVETWCSEMPEIVATARYIRIGLFCRRDPSEHYTDIAEFREGLRRNRRQFKQTVNASDILNKAD